MGSTQSKDTLKNAALWENAQQYAQLIGAIPMSFSSSIRLIIADVEQSASLSDASKFEAGRLLKTPSLQTVLFYATKTFSPNILDDNALPHPPLLGSGLLPLVDPEALAVFLGMSYLYRRAKKICAPTEWNFFTKNLPMRTDIGGLVGSSVPSLGCGKGVLIATLDTLALSCFHLTDPKGFIDYRRSNNLRTISESIHEEIRRWGTTRYHIGGLLLQMVGFGSNYSINYTEGMSHREEDETPLSKGAEVFFRGKECINQIEQSGKAPVGEGELHLDENEISELLESIDRIRVYGSPFSWLERDTQIQERELSNESVLHSVFHKTAEEL